MGVAPLIMAVVEPWITRKRFDPRELLIGVAAMPGVMLVVGGTPDGMRLGLAVGVLSAFLVAVFGSLNKRYIEPGEPLAVTGLELAAGTAFLTLLALAVRRRGDRLAAARCARRGLLLVLSLGCTLFPFALSLAALRNLSAFTAQLAVSLEPVYAVVLAILLLGEQRELGLQFYAGLAIILGSVLGARGAEAGVNPGVRYLRPCTCRSLTKEYACADNRTAASLCGIPQAYQSPALSLNRVPGDQAMDCVSHGRPARLVRRCIGLSWRRPHLPVAEDAGRNFEIYGFAQADFIQDFDGRLDPDWDDAFRPSKIGLDEQFGSDGQSSISVKQSRFGVKGRMPTGEGGTPLSFKFEFDLFGTGADAGQTTFRLRHAYGEWGPLLAGQTNTLFMDGDVFPNTIDYWGPAGMVFYRNVQIR